MYFNFFERNPVCCSLSSHFVCHFISASFVASSRPEVHLNVKAYWYSKSKEGSCPSPLGLSYFLTLKSDGSAVGPGMGLREALLRSGSCGSGPQPCPGMPQSHSSLLRSQHLFWMLPLDTERSLPVTTGCP